MTAREILGQKIQPALVMKTHPILAISVLLVCGTFGYSQSPKASSAPAVASGVPADDPFIGYVFTELGQRLTEHGTTTALDEVTERLLARYERMPPVGRTRETRAGHALALAGVGAIGGWITSDRLGDSFLGEPAARARLERAMEITRELEAGGPLTPFIRLSSGAVSYTMALQLFREHRYGDTVAALERAEDPGHLLE